MKEFVLNNSTFWEFIRNLRNDERIKHGFVKQDQITKQEHKKYKRSTFKSNSNLNHPFISN